MKKESTEEDLRQAFYKGREQKTLPDNDSPQFIRPTFNGKMDQIPDEKNYHNFDNTLFNQAEFITDIVAWAVKTKKEYEQLLVEKNKLQDEIDELNGNYDWENIN